MKTIIFNRLIGFKFVHAKLSDNREKVVVWLHLAVDLAGTPQSCLMNSREQNANLCKFY